MNPTLSPSSDPLSHPSFPTTKSYIYTPHFPKPASLPPRTSTPSHRIQSSTYPPKCVFPYPVRLTIIAHRIQNQESRHGIISEARLRGMWLGREISGSRLGWEWVRWVLWRWGFFWSCFRCMCMGSFRWDGSGVENGREWSRNFEVLGSLGFGLDRTVGHSGQIDYQKRDKK